MAVLTRGDVSRPGRYLPAASISQFGARRGSRWLFPWDQTGLLIVVEKYRRRKAGEHPGGSECARFQDGMPPATGEGIKLHPVWRLLFRANWFAVQQEFHVIDGTGRDARDGRKLNRPINGRAW
jgi:hypothetical protein